MSAPAPMRPGAHARAHVRTRSVIMLSHRVCTHSAHAPLVLFWGNAHGLPRTATQAAAIQRARTPTVRRC